MKQRIRKLCKAMLLLTVSLCLNAQAETFTWIGAAGDRKWSSGANWDKGSAPADGDSLILRKVEADGMASVLTFENDLVGVAFADIAVEGTTPVVLNGLPLAIGGQLDCWPSATFNMPIEFTGIRNPPAYQMFLCAVPNGSTAIPEYVFNGAVTSSQTEGSFVVSVAVTNEYTTVNDSLANLTFRKGLDVSGLPLQLACTGDLVFDGPLKAQKLDKPYKVLGYSIGWRIKTLHFRAAGNHLGGVENYRIHNFSIEVPNAFDETSVLGFPGDNESNWVGSDQVLLLKGNDLTVDRLTSGLNSVYGDPAKTPVDDAFAVYAGDTRWDGTKAATLTLKGSADAGSYIGLKYKLSLVWDPVCDCTQIFSNRVHSMSGSIVVKGGCLKFEGASTAKNVPLVKVEGNGRLAFGTATSDFFDGSKVDVRLAKAARLEIPGGTVISVKTALTNGVPLVAGTYTGVGGAEGEVIENITGTGKLIVGQALSVNHWLGGNGNWKEADNWSAGVPTTAAAVLSGGYNAISMSGATLASGLVAEIENGSDGQTTLTFSDEAEISGVKFNLGRNAVLQTVDGADVHLSDSTVTVGKDATLRLAGGELKTDKLSALPAGGTLEVKGSAKLRPNVLDRPFKLFGSGRVEFSENAQLVDDNNGNIWNFTPDAKGEVCEVTFSGHARFEGSPTDSTVLNTLGLNDLFSNGGVAYGKTIFTMKDYASGWLCRALFIAKGPDTYAEMNMADQSYAFIRNYGVRIGNGGTDPAHPSHGVFRMTGGAIEVNPATKENGDERLGLVVGDGSQCEANGAANVGEVFLSGGAITNDSVGALLVGVGSGKGSVVQTGGLLKQVLDYPAVFGLRGGIGEYRLSAGRYESAGDVYIGGCPLGVLECTFAKLPTDKAGVGSLEVSGGIFAAKNLYVSKAGRGEMKVSGGSVNVTNLELCETEMADAAPVLTFTVGANGEHGLITALGKLTIGSSARIVIDLGYYDGKPVKLMMADTVEGTLTPANVTLRGKHLANAKWTFRDGVLRAGCPRGLALIFR